MGGADIGPGDLVECIDDGPGRRSGVKPNVVRGLIYTVAAVNRVGDASPFGGVFIEAGFILRGVEPNRVKGVLYHPAPRRFRPVRRPDPKFIEGLLSLPLDVREDA